MPQPESVRHVRAVVQGNRGPLLTADFRRGRSQRDLIDVLGGLDHGRALYELVPFGLEGEPIPTPTIASLAEAYCTEIIAELEGPFCVAGYCQGGLLAYAVAGRLQAMACEVPLLVLIDSHLSGGWALASEFKRIVRGATGQEPPPAARETLARAEGALTADPDSALAELSSALASLMEPMHPHGSDYTATLLRELAQRYRAWLAYLVAAANFRPDRYRGRIELFVARPASKASDSWLAWGDAVIREVDVPHDQLLGDPGLRDALTGLLAGADIAGRR